MAEAHLKWEADTAGAIAKTEALKRAVASVGGTQTTNAIRNLGAAWKIIVPAIAAAGVAILGLTGNMAALAPLLPVVTALLAAFLAPFTALAAVVVGFIPPLTLLVGLLGGLGLAFGLAGKRALAGGGIFKDFASVLEKVKGQFHDLVYTLGKDFLPIFMMLIKSASTALSYLNKIAHLPLKQAFQSLSTTGVQGFQKFLDKVGHILAKPIRLAFQVAFGQSDTLRRALVDDWNDIVNFFVGHKGVLLPVQKWFGKQDFTAVGMRWATELAGALMRGLEMALKKIWASDAGKRILIGGLSGAAIGAFFGPIGALIGLAIGTGAGIALNHVWSKIFGGLSKQSAKLGAQQAHAIGTYQGQLSKTNGIFAQLGAAMRQAIGPALWNDIIRNSRLFWSNLQSVIGVAKSIGSAIGGWKVVLTGIVSTIRVVAFLFDGVLSIVNAIAGAVSAAASAAQALASGLGGSPGSGGQGGTPSTGKGHLGGTGRHARTASTAGSNTATQVHLHLDSKVIASVLVDADKTYRRQNGGRGLFAV